MHVPPPQSLLGLASEPHSSNWGEAAWWGMVRVGGAFGLQRGRQKGSGDQNLGFQQDTATNQQHLPFLRKLAFLGILGFCEEGIIYDHS